MLAQRYAMPPLGEPAYSFPKVPKWKLSQPFVVHRPTRDECVRNMAELLLCCNEAVQRQHRTSAASDRRKRPYHAGKPLLLEYMSDRLDIDDPMQAYMVRSKEGWLQGFVTYTNFTTWHKHFRWDSLDECAEIDPSLEDNEGHLLDDNGSIARELNSQTFVGNPSAEGIVWPRICEIALVGALGCGRWLLSALIEELESPSSQYDFIVLQATDNSISFYESLGFRRVGAVACHEDSGTRGKGKKEGDSEWVCSASEEYTTTATETAAQICRKFNVRRFALTRQTCSSQSVCPCCCLQSCLNYLSLRCQVRLFDLLCINPDCKVPLLEDGPIARGTTLRVPRVTPDEPRWCKAQPWDTPQKVAARFGIKVP